MSVVRMVDNSAVRSAKTSAAHLVAMWAGKLADQMVASTVEQLDGTKVAWLVEMSVDLLVARLVGTMDGKWVVCSVETMVV